MTRMGLGLKIMVFLIGPVPEGNGAGRSCHNDRFGEAAPARGSGWIDRQRDFHQGGPVPDLIAGFPEQCKINLGYEVRVVRGHFPDSGPGRTSGAL